MAGIRTARTRDARGRSTGPVDDEMATGRWHYGSRSVSMPRPLALLHPCFHQSRDGQYDLRQLRVLHPGSWQLAHQEGPLLARMSLAPSHILGKSGGPLLS